MANEEHLVILKRGVEAWDVWRRACPEVVPDLGRAQLNGANLAQRSRARGRLGYQVFNALPKALDAGDPDPMVIWASQRARQRSASNKAHAVRWAGGISHGDRRPALETDLHQKQELYMDARPVVENVQWGGAIDWDRRLFDALISLPDGTSHSTYLVRGSQKTASSTRWIRLALTCSPHG
jgi:hypothetical protein